MAEEDAPAQPCFIHLFSIISLMMQIAPTVPSFLPLVISLLCLLWLSLCASFDLRKRHIPNWLTLPAIPLAMLAAWLEQPAGTGRLDEYLFHQGFLVLSLLIAWRNHLLGGADLKILVALSLVNPWLLVAAWLGVVLYFIGMLCLANRRATRFAGVPGFALGIGLFYFGQLASFLTQHLAA
jgi:Flp pilus assembly protein protease CpaA